MLIDQVILIDMLIKLFGLKDVEVIQKVTNVT